jgi:hypothetical protein
MEAVNHALLTRQELLQFNNENQMSGSLLIPEDGEAIEL